MRSAALLCLASLLACAGRPAASIEAPGPQSESDVVPASAPEPVAMEDDDPDGLGDVDTTPGPPVISFEDDDDAGPAEHVEGARPTPEMPSFEIMGMNGSDGPG